MNLALWIAAGLLATAFLVGGVGKLVMPREKIAATRFGGWAGDMSTGLVWAIGVLEVLGAIGLILPAVTGIATVLVPTAAVGIALMMVGAAITHFRRGEYAVILGNLGYLAIAAFVAWGRFGPEAFGG